MATPIQGPQTATVGQAITRVKNTQPQRVTFVVEYVRELWRLCELARLNPVVLLAQAYHETGVAGKGPFESEVWLKFGNPAGIGVTDGPNRSLVYASGTDAARAHVVHMAGYVQGDTGWVYDSPFKALDPQWDALTQHARFGRVRNVEDLGSGVWATQDSTLYSGAILRYMREIEAAADPVPADQGTKTDPQVPAATRAVMPPVEWIGTDNYHARGMDPIGIIYHITDDLVLDHTVSWFQDPSSDASSTLVIARDGTSLQFVSSKNAPWTNGDVQQPRMDVGYCQEMRRRGGNWNNGAITIETVADRHNPPTEAQYKALIEWTRYFTHPDVYGKTIKKIRGYLGRHSDINSVGRPYCPGQDRPDGTNTFDLGRIIRAVGGDPAKLA